MVAVITGGTGTLGRPMAEAMAAAGLPVFFIFVAVVFVGLFACSFFVCPFFARAIYLVSA